MDLAKRCARASGNDSMEIKSYENKLVSVCPARGDDDCFYSRTYGRTYEYATPDLNLDGRADAVVQDFSGAYGQHDVVHFMVFAQCKDGTYIKVAEDMLRDVAAATSPGEGGWADLVVTRTCFNAAINDSQTRRFRLTFNSQTFQYGPPDNDLELIEYCSDKEMSLPAAEESPS